MILFSHLYYFIVYLASKIFGSSKKRKTPRRKRKKLARSLSLRKFFHNEIPSEKREREAKQLKKAQDFERK